MATYQQWSQSYFPDLTLDQHDVNNQWFQCMRDRLTDSGILYVPILDKEFNKLGEELWYLLTSIVTLEEERMASNLSVLNVNQFVQFITLAFQD